MAQTAATPKPKAPPSPTTQFNRNIIFLDPAHGGPDPGAHLTDTLPEKDVTLALANRLRDALTAKGFTVISSRQPDETANTPQLSLDERAGLANHARPVACILLHVTTAGRGTHLFTASLTPPVPEPLVLPWDTAQSIFVPQSVRLANELGTAIARAHIPIFLSHADPRPLDNLTCPAIAIELSPLPADADNSTITPVTDASYQQRLADAIAGTLIFWKGHAEPPPSPSQGDATTP